MKKYLLDTNVVLRYVCDDVPGQSTKVAELFRLAKQGDVTLYIPTIVFFEITYALVSMFNVSRQDVKKLCEQLLLIPYLEIPDRELLRSVYDTWGKEVGVSFADVTLHHMATLGGYELVTFDKKLKKIAEKRKGI